MAPLGVSALAAFAAVCSGGAAKPAEAVKPHIIFILADDLGWNSVWNNPDIHTPTIDSMAAEGLKLTSQYAYRYCSPTRAAFLTGRSPYKLLNIRDNLQNEQVTDPRFTYLPKRLAEAGYYSYQIGKWHLGMKSRSDTPVGRGFSESYGFLKGSEDHFDSTVAPKCDVFGKVVDYYAQSGEYSEEGGPITTCDVPVADRKACPLFTVISQNESASKAADLCAGGAFKYCAHDAALDSAVPCYQCFAKRYTGFDFAKHAVGIIERHAREKPTTPMFMYLSLQNTHAPIQAPDEYVALYDFGLKKQNVWSAMVSVIDSTVENVTAALQTTGMWENTLLVWTTDNGSPTNVAGSNDPLRGSKGVAWEGGTRVPTFISGGLLPKPMVGRTLDGIVTMWDYFATFCAFAGVDPTELRADSPSPVDSFDVWPYLSGAVEQSPRNELVYDHLQFTRNSSACIFNGYIQAAPCMGAGAIRYGDYKLLVGTHGKATQFGRFSPNASFSMEMFGIYLCSMDRPCLFNVTGDMEETRDLSDERPEVVLEMLDRYHAYDTEYHPPSDLTPSEDDEICEKALNNGGFLTPWRRDDDKLIELV